MPAEIADQFARGRTMIHRVDARGKIGVAVALVVATVAVPLAWWPAYIALAGVVTGIYVAARLPAGYLLKRLAVTMPLIATVAIGAPLSHGFDGGFDIAATIVIRAMLALSIMVTLLATTPYEKLLAALERLRVPHTLIWVLAFMYRYLFVLADELARMRQAKAARSFGRSSWLDFQVMANFVGVLFVRAFERAERVYAAMCARGWTSEREEGINDLRLKR